MTNKNFTKIMEPIVRVGPKHQATIPAEIFKKLQLEIGDFLIFK